MRNELRWWERAILHTYVTVWFLGKCALLAVWFLILIGVGVAALAIIVFLVWLAVTFAFGWYRHTMPPVPL